MYLWFLGYKHTIGIELFEVYKFSWILWYSAYHEINPQQLAYLTNPTIVSITVGDF